MNCSICDTPINNGFENLEVMTNSGLITYDLVCVNCVAALARRPNENQNLSAEAYLRGQFLEYRMMTINHLTQSMGSLLAAHTLASRNDSVKLSAANQHIMKALDLLFEIKPD